MPHATARRTCSQTVRDECLYHYEGFDQSTVSMNTIVNCLVVTRSLRAAIAQWTDGSCWAPSEVALCACLRIVGVCTLLLSTLWINIQRKNALN